MSRASVSATITWPAHGDYILVATDIDGGGPKDPTYNITTVHGYGNDTYYFIRVSVASTTNIGNLAVLFDINDDGDGDIAVESFDSDSDLYIYTWGSSSYWEHDSPYILADHVQTGNWPTGNYMYMEIAVPLSLVSETDRMEIHILHQDMIFDSTSTSGGSSVGVYHSMNDPTEIVSISSGSFADEIPFTPVPSLFEAPLFTLLVISSVAFVVIRRWKNDKRKNE